MFRIYHRWQHPPPLVAPLRCFGLGSSSIAIKCAFKDFMKAISSQMPSNALNCSRQASRALLMCPGSLSRAMESIRGHLRTNSFHKVFKSAFDGN